MENFEFTVHKTDNYGLFRVLKGNRIVEQKRVDKIKASMENIKIKARDGEIFTVGGMEFIKFPNVNGATPVVMKDIAFFAKFGDNNDFRKSVVLELMKSEILPKVIAAIGEENLCTIKTDLTALDGLNPYGEMESLISLPTMDFYRANVSIFDKYKPNRWWWLATPESAQPHDNTYWILCVSPSGCIYDVHYNCDGGVRPFLLFNSSIFESSED